MLPSPQPIQTLKVVLGLDDPTIYKFVAECAKSRIKPFLLVLIQYLNASMLTPNFKRSKGIRS